MREKQFSNTLILENNQKNRIDTFCNRPIYNINCCIDLDRCLYRIYRNKD